MIVNAARKSACATMYMHFYGRITGWLSRAAFGGELF